MAGNRELHRNAPRQKQLEMHMPGQPLPKAKLQAHRSSTRASQKRGATILSQFTANWIIEHLIQAIHHIREGDYDEAVKSIAIAVEALNERSDDS